MKIDRRHDGFKVKVEEEAVRVKPESTAQTVAGSALSIVGFVLFIVMILHAFANAQPSINEQTG